MELYLTWLLGRSQISYQVEVLDSACDAEVEQAKSVARSRAAKKNEKRKQKKTETGPDASTAARKQSDSIADQMEALRYVSDCDHENFSMHLLPAWPS